ncbi:MAG TPA: BamA/TamA family outer membrane protein [Gemmatimonadaceae bacterium]|nr:BamA/TamA family outer membrane protein [Gemmatimonadaceae bacterium]
MSPLVHHSSRPNPRGIAAAFAAFLVLAVVARAAIAQSPDRSRVELSGIPALNFDSDEGFGYGVVLAAYDYRPKRASYDWTIEPTVFLTTRGRRDYTIFFDAPAGATRHFRYTAFAGREEQLAAPYYGIGNDTPYDPSVESGSTRYFYRYGRNRLRAAFDVQHSIGRPSLRALFGGGISNDRIDLTPFDSGSTLIEHEVAGQTPPTGHTNYLRVGITWDTRDREIAPHTGTWIDVLAQRVDRRFGASSDYTRWTGTARRYQPLGDRLTLASRLVAQHIAGDAPFYVLADIQTTQQWQDGLGGSSSVRGLPKDRYVGKGLMFANNELRWRAADFKLVGRPSSVVLSAFADAGRVWSGGIDPSTAVDELHAGYGAGTRLAFGDSFVIATDVGHSSLASAAVYVGLGYLF